MTHAQPPLRHCDICAHLAYLTRCHRVVCGAGHAPRFYQPRSPMDESWGYKRRCGDFTPRKETP